MFLRSRAEQRFPPNAGRTVGYLGLALGAGFIVLGFPYLSFRPWLTISLGVAAAGVALWAIVLRPRAYATADHLILLNMVTNTWIPLAAIERVEPKHALFVWAHGKKHLCVGIVKSRWVAMGRGRLRSGRPSPWSIEARAGWQRPSSDPLVRARYEDMVADRIEKLAEDARKQGKEAGPVRREPAVLELGMLAVSLAAFALVLYL